MSLVIPITFLLKGGPVGDNINIKVNAMLCYFSLYYAPCKIEIKNSFEWVA